MVWLILAAIVLTLLVAVLAVLAEVTYYRNETAEMRQLKRSISFMKSEQERRFSK